MQKVHKTKTGLTKKLHDKYMGRFYIKERGPFDTYKIADCRTNKPVKTFIIAQDLRRYYELQIIDMNHLVMIYLKLKVMMIQLYMIQMMQN